MTRPRGWRVDRRSVHAKASPPGRGPRAGGGKASMGALVCPRLATTKLASIVFRARFSPMAEVTATRAPSTQDLGRAALHPRGLDLLVGGDRSTTRRAPISSPRCRPRPPPSPSSSSRPAAPRWTPTDSSTRWSRPGWPPTARPSPDRSADRAGPAADHGQGVAGPRQQAVRSYMDYGTGLGESPPHRCSPATRSTPRPPVSTRPSPWATSPPWSTSCTPPRPSSSAHQASLRQQQDRDRADQASQAADLSQANAGAGQLAALHNQVTGQLAAAVAAQAATQNAAAVAAVAAAQKQAAKPDPGRPATTVTQTVTTIPAPTTPGSTVTGTGHPAARGGRRSPRPRPQPVPPVRDPAGIGRRLQHQHRQRVLRGLPVQPVHLEHRRPGRRPRPTWWACLPSSASKAEQDTVAVALYALDGGRPWTGDCGA